MVLEAQGTTAMSTIGIKGLFIETTTIKLSQDLSREVGAKDYSIVER